jgi:cytochrome c oxidase assembly protein subunit 15
VLKGAHRLALLTGGATLVLIVFGGLVTATGSALAVPDWPTTFGHNMFLYPWSQMVGGVFYEHSHRLLGALVGLLTLGLAAQLWRVGETLGWLGLAAAATVVAQGVLGGLRVVLQENGLAIAHGCLAQAYVALLAVIALLTSPRAATPLSGVEPSLRMTTLAAAAVVYAQIVSGALMSHAGWLELHLVSAVAVFALVPVVAARLRRSGDPVAAPVARALLVVLVIQLGLGAGSLLVRARPETWPGGTLVLPVAHRLAASLVLAAAVILAARAWTARVSSSPSIARAKPAPGQV